MPSRNTAILNEILDVLGSNLISPLGALAELEEHFKDKLVMVAGDVQLVEQQAQELRLAITTAEAHQVLNYIAAQKLIGIPIETTDEVINLLFPDRFQEP
jgi:hypothetical protein